MPTKFRRIIRKLAGQSGTPYPIQIVDGDSLPQLCGHSYYWTTPSGKTIVRHPNAYGWRTLYHGSTRRIEVGRDFLAALASGLNSVNG